MKRRSELLSQLHQPFPRSTVESLIYTPVRFTILLTALTATLLVGIRFYIDSMPPINTFLWPLYIDTPVAIAFAIMSLMTTAPFISQTLTDVPNNTLTAFIHTFAFTWLIKYGVWVTIALNIHPLLYITTAQSGWFSYPMIIFSHSLFIILASIIVTYGKTTRSALLTTLILLLLNDVYDYVFEFHPPLKYTPKLLLPTLTTLLTITTVLLAWWQFDFLHSK